MLIRNSAIYMVAKLLPGLFGLATTAALTRLLDPHEYGLYGLALVVMMLGSIHPVRLAWLVVSPILSVATRRPKLGLDVHLHVLRAGHRFGGSARRRVDRRRRAGGFGWHLCLKLAHGVGVLMVRSGFPTRSGGIPAARSIMKMNLGRSLLVLGGATTAAWLTRSPLWTALATGAGIFAGTFFGRIPIPRPSWRLFDRDLARDVLVFGAPVAASMALFSLIDGGTRILLEQLDSARGARSLYRRVRFGCSPRLGSLREESRRPAIRSWCGRSSAATTPRRGGNSWPMGRYCWRCSLPPVWA